jgi:hypothetical protein
MADATLTDIELARLLHIDGEDETANAVAAQLAAEVYLTNAGVTKDYANPLYKQVVVSIVAKMLDQPDLLTNLTESTGFTLVGLIHQLRLAQAAASTTGS